MTTFDSIYGTVVGINDFWSGTEELIGCYKLMTVQQRDGSIVNFVVSPDTYFVNHKRINLGDQVIGFYDALVPVPLIYPPQYRAIVISGFLRNQNVKVDFFNKQLVSSDGTLKLNIGPFTEVILENDQVFTGNITNRNLIVIYGPTTRSIPAQTTPYKIIVMCPKSQ